VTRYVLAPAAARDLVGIWRYVKNESSREIADRVEANVREKMAFLANARGAGHRRHDLTEEDVRFFPIYSYLIVYSPNTRPLQVVAIRHGARDVARLLTKRLG
jgi:antitoxin ParD1/3/4/toxin ParE1/3/4